MTTPAWIRREVHCFLVVSCADGTLRLEPEYVHEPVEPGCAVLGVDARMALAEWVQRVVNRELEGQTSK